ncbi:MAG: tetratricopeptide (TPR) repeat protein [Spirosomataceae bacterium]|jgi:tetratricopeptide (TPR) repeat protein
MSQDHRNRREDPNIKESALQFEAMLNNKESHFMEEITYESLADYYLVNGKLELATIACEMGISSYPHSLQLQLLRAELYIGKYEFTKALNLLDQVSILNPSDTEISFLRGVVLDLLGDHVQALEVFQEILTITPDKDAVYFQLGVVFQHLDEYDKAVYCFKKAVSHNPDNHPALYELVHSIDQTDEVESFLPYFQELTESDPFAHAAWFCLGMCHNHLGNTEETIEAYEYAVAIKDDFFMAWYNLGHVFMNTEQYANAQEAYGTAAKLEETAEIYTHLAASYEKVDEFQTAYINYRKATELDEAYADAWFGMASVLYEEGRSMEAIHFVKKAIKLREENGDYWLLLGDTEAQLGNFLSSVEAYEKAVTYDPLNLDTWLNWSLLYWELKEHGKALEIIQEGLHELPDEADLHYRAAVYLVFAGNYNEAYRYLETGLTLNYDGHTQIYDFFTELDTQKALHKIIQQYKE